LQRLVIANLALILLFPPFETQPLAARIGDRPFEGFRFALGGNVQRGSFLPLLYLERLLLALIATSLWLAFGLVARNDVAPAEGLLEHCAEALVARVSFVTLPAGNRERR
jgi:hypothetical protein